VRGDLADPTSLERAFDDVDGLVTTADSYVRRRTSCPRVASPHAALRGRSFQYRSGSTSATAQVASRRGWRGGPVVRILLRPGLCFLLPALRNSNRRLAQHVTGECG
jgi:hypothetical protein